jgi:serine/threonine protein kinase
MIDAALRAALADRYRIEREIGAGGMATVYLAEDLKHHRKVALKVLRPELSAQLGPERFLHEIALTASLQNPHIVPLFDSGAIDGQLFYVMPYVDGETLRARIARGPVPLDESLGILRDVARALAYAHARGVIHRDIKPDNVLLSSGTAVVTDFGIAKALSASRDMEADAANMTLTRGKSCTATSSRTTSFSRRAPPSSPTSASPRR